MLGGEHVHLFSASRDNRSFQSASTTYELTIFHLLPAAMLFMSIGTDVFTFLLLPLSLLMSRSTWFTLFNLFLTSVLKHQIYS